MVPSGKFSVFIIIYNMELKVKQILFVVLVIDNIIIRSYMSCYVILNV